MSSVTKDPGVSSILLFSGSGINFPRPLYICCYNMVAAKSSIAPLFRQKYFPTITDAQWTVAYHPEVIVRDVLHVKTETLLICPNYRQFLPTPFFPSTKSPVLHGTTVSELQLPRLYLQALPVSTYRRWQTKIKKRPSPSIQHCII